MHEQVPCMDYVRVTARYVGEEGAKSHRGNLSLAQNSIMQMRKSPDNVTLHDPKQ